MLIPRHTCLGKQRESRNGGIVGQGDSHRFDSGTIQRSPRPFAIPDGQCDSTTINVKLRQGAVDGQGRRQRIDARVVKVVGVDGQKSERGICVQRLGHGNDPRIAQLIAFQMQFS